MDIDFTVSDPTVKYAMTFESPRIADQYYRTYAKIQNLFANIGGIFSIIMMLGKLICLYISEYSLYFVQAKHQIFFHNLNIELSQKHLKVENNVRKDTELQIIPFESNSNIKSTNKVKSLFSDKEPSDFEFKKGSNITKPMAPKDNTINQGSELKETKNKDHKKDISNNSKSTNTKLEESKLQVNHHSLGFCNYIMTLFCKADNCEKTMYNAIIHYFEKQLSIIDLIKLRRDVYILKYLLLSEKVNYEDLFNYQIPIENIITEFEAKTDKEENDVNDEKQRSKQFISRSEINQIQEKFARFNIMNDL